MFYPVKSVIRSSPFSYSKLKEWVSPNYHSLCGVWVRRDQASPAPHCRGLHSVGAATGVSIGNTGLYGHIFVSARRRAPEQVTPGGSGMAEKVFAEQITCYEGTEGRGSRVQRPKDRGMSRESRLFGRIGRQCVWEEAEGLESEKLLSVHCWARLGP